MDARPIVYQGRQFPSRIALAQHLAPLLGKSVDAVRMALCRHDGDVESIRSGRSRASNADPVVYQGRQFPSRRALAEYLAPLLGRSRSMIRALLTKYNGDVERVLATPRYPGKIRPNRNAPGRP
jgi:hypothetical protein